MHRTNRLLASAPLAALLLLSEAARAQTSAATVSASGQAFPDRIVNGVDLGSSTRAQNLTPLGINYSDCVSDMTLSFNVVVSGFDGTENLQVWASKSSDCRAVTDRGGSGAVTATCWLVNPGFTAQPHSAPTTLNFTVRVQDLVGAQNAPPFPANYVRQGPSACAAQTTFAAVPINVNFVPVDSSGNYAGTLYSFTAHTDLVGPPAPAGVSKSIGDTLLFVNWNVNLDSDTSGYDVFIDPIPGQEGLLGGPSGNMSVQVCDAGASTPIAQDEAAGVALDSGVEGSADSAVDTSTDAADDSAIADSGIDVADSAIAEASAKSMIPDADCYTINVGGALPSGGCTSALLASAIMQDGGFVQQVDDAGNAIEGGLINGSGGISTIPASNLVGVASQGVTVPDRSTGTYTIAGLVNDSLYNVAVAAVDGYGNIGPPSPEVCDKPEPVNDFWKIYRQDGGKAGGGLCALEAVGAPASSTISILIVVGTSTALARRRRGRRR